MKNWGALLAGIVGVMMGLVLPDIDISLGRTSFRSLIQHRSLLTHSFLIPIALFALTRQAERTSILRWFTMGVSVALATHLCFDLFPWRWHGTALIYAPFVGRLDPSLSILWILLSAVVSLGAAFALVRHLHELVLVIGALVFTYAAAASYERAFWLPLFVLAGVAVIGLGLGFAVPRERRYI